jgi:hypothetical protein
MRCRGRSSEPPSAAGCVDRWAGQAVAAQGSSLCLFACHGCSCGTLKPAGRLMLLSVKLSRLPGKHMLHAALGRARELGCLLRNACQPAPGARRPTGWPAPWPPAACSSSAPSGGARAACCCAWVSAVWGFFAMSSLLIWALPGHHTSRPLGTRRVGVGTQASQWSTCWPVVRDVRDRVKRKEGHGWPMVAGDSLINCQPVHAALGDSVADLLRVNVGVSASLLRRLTAASTLPGDWPGSVLCSLPRMSTPGPLCAWQRVLLIVCRGQAPGLRPLGVFKAGCRLI